MKRVLITGMSGTGKSTVLRRLAEFGFRVIDTEEGGFTVSVKSASGTERLWREDRIQAILSTLTAADVMFVSGTCRNQVRFYPQFDRIVLLSAPASVLVDRLATRTNNPYGTKPEEVAETLHFIETVEPLLRNAATMEVDTNGPVDEVVRAILQHVLE